MAEVDKQCPDAQHPLPGAAQAIARQPPGRHRDDQREAVNAAGHEPDVQRRQLLRHRSQPICWRQRSLPQHRHDRHDQQRVEQKRDQLLAQLRLEGAERQNDRLLTPNPLQRNRVQRHLEQDGLNVLAFAL